MKDLISAFLLFSNAVCLYNGERKGSDKYTLCYFPLVGAVIGIILYFICILFKSAGINSVLTGGAALALYVLFMGKVYFGLLFKVWGRISFLFDIVIAVLLWAVFSLGSMRGISVVCGAFVVSRVLAILFMYENSRLDEGMFKELADKGSKGVTSVITVVWLMGSVAFIEMQSIVCFFIVFFTGVLLYILFHMEVKKKGKFGDRHINSFIAAFESAVFAEVIILVYIGVLQ